MKVQGRVTLISVCMCLDMPCDYFVVWYEEVCSFGIKPWVSDSSCQGLTFDFLWLLVFSLFFH